MSALWFIFAIQVAGIVANVVMLALDGGLVSAVAALVCTIIFATTVIAIMVMSR